MRPVFGLAKILRNMKFVHCWGLADRLRTDRQALATICCCGEDFEDAVGIVGDGREVNLGGGVAKKAAPSHSAQPVAALLDWPSAQFLLRSGALWLWSATTAAGCGA